MSKVRFRISQRSDSATGDVPIVIAQVSLLDAGGRTVRTRPYAIPISPHERDALVVDLEPGTHVIETRLPTGELIVDSVVVREAVESNVVLQAKSAPEEWPRSAHSSGDKVWWHRVGSAPPSSKSYGRSPVRDAQIGRGVARKARVPGRVARKLPRLGSDRPSETPVDGQAPGRPVLPSQFFQSLSTSEVANAIEATYLHAGIDLMGSIGLMERDGRVYPSQWSKTPSVWLPEEPAKMQPGQPIYLLERNGISDASDFLQVNPWQTLSELEGATAKIILGLKAGRRDRAVRPVADDSSSAVFQIARRHAGNRKSARGFAVVRRRKGVELICLPTTWAGSESAHFADIGVGVRHPRYEHEFSTSVVVRNRRLSLLLGFLSTGDLSMVNSLLAGSLELLFEKSADPIAAAAAGYALVGSVVDARRQPWHKWIWNLMEGYEIPDGAIQYGMMRLRLRSSESDVREAVEAFKLAYERGLPIFGMGMRWLLDGLEQASAIDEEARELAATVRRLSFRLHPKSAFTILRLGKC